jgi:hypothetical protein
LLELSSGVQGNHSKETGRQLFEFIRFQMIDNT